MHHAKSLSFPVKVGEKWVVTVSTEDGQKQLSSTSRERLARRLVSRYGFDREGIERLFR